MTKDSMPDLAKPVSISQSAAVFVGIREFSREKRLTEVMFAADDAVDLAYFFSVESPLVRPDRAVLALSGKPQKRESQARLKELKDRGARVTEARHDDILQLLDDQAREVGRDGIFIAAFATHGINDRGIQHLLTASSFLNHLETSLTETKLRNILAESKVPRALVLIDACRERLTTDVRAGSVSRRSAAAKLMEELGKMSGHVILSAAAPDQYAYDYNGNGVFTAAVIEGLRCKAATDDNGFVTVGTLHQYVEERVLSWIQKYRLRQARRATQLSVEGRASAMPLSVCAPVSGTR